MWDTTIKESPDECETPDPAFTMTSIINEDDIDSDDIVDFDATTSSSTFPNPFIKYEADERCESSSNYEEDPAFKVARRQ